MTNDIPNSSSFSIPVDGATPSNELQSSEANSPPTADDFFNALKDEDSAKIEGWIQNKQIGQSIWDSTRPGGQSPLHYFAKNPKFSCAAQVVALIKMAPPELLDRPNNQGETPMIAAAKRDNELVLLHLALAGAAPNIRDPKDNTTVLMIAAGQDMSPEITRYLCRHGALINAKDNDGNTVLHHAVNQQSEKALPALIAAGADTRIRNEAGHSALDIALEREPDLEGAQGDEDAGPKVSMKTALRSSKADMLAYVGSFFGDEFCADLLKASELMLDAVAGAIEYALGIHIETPTEAYKRHAESLLSERLKGR